jgi:hypothetical protein
MAKKLTSESRATHADRAHAAMAAIVERTLRGALQQSGAKISIPNLTSILLYHISWVGEDVDATLTLGELRDARRRGVDRREVITPEVTA